MKKKKHKKGDLPKRHGDGPSKFAPKKKKGKKVTG